MSNLINISSVPAESTTDQQLQVVARWKDTDKRPVSPANRCRAVILPATIWSADASVTAVTDKAVRSFLLDAVADLAKEYLSAIVEDSGWQRTTVNEDAFTLTSLLNWNAERAAAAGRLNGDDIKKWLAASVTIANAATKHGDAIAKALGEQFVKLASPNHGLSPERAEKLLATLWAADDADSNIGYKVQQRLTAISKKNETADILGAIL